MINAISFVARALPPDGRVRQIVPVIDGSDLTELVGRYETKQGYDVPGEYGGIIPAFFNCGPLLDYYLGAPKEAYWREDGKVAVLGCSCGEVGCWPLYVHVDVQDNVVVWSDFEQPFRKERDYSGFGPFSFEREAYEQAVKHVIQAIKDE